MTGRLSLFPMIDNYCEDLFLTTETQNINSVLRCFCGSSLLSLSERKHTRNGNTAP